MSHDLTLFVPAPRLKPYRDIVGNDLKALDKFYRWAQRLSGALFTDIGHLEVVMRSAMARELSAEFGQQWYGREDLFEDRAASMITRAWEEKGLGKLGAPDHVLEGKLIASLTFGFWTQLLSSGGKVSRPAVVQHRRYDWLLWQPALRKAFPGASTRSEVKNDADDVRHVRNRIAHQERIAWGSPIPGQGRTLAVSDVSQTVLRLAAAVDPAAAAWIETRSKVQKIIKKCPVPILGTDLKL